MALSLPFTDPMFGDFERTMRQMLGPGGGFIGGGQLGFPSAGMPTSVATHAFDVLETDRAYVCITGGWVSGRSGVFARSHYRMTCHESDRTRPCTPCPATHADAPGMTPDDVHVELNGDYLVGAAAELRVQA
jgi:hypothetical protein